MNRRNSLQLRSTNITLSPVKRKSRKRSSLLVDAESERKYERRRKQKWRERISGGVKGKRGPKTKIDIKNMTLGELRRYERERKRAQRLKKKSKTMDDSDMMSKGVDEVLEEDVDEPFLNNNARLVEESETVLRIVNDSSKKTNARQIIHHLEEKLKRLDEMEVLDVMVALVQALSESIKDRLKEEGVVVHKLPRFSKRYVFSNISTSRKHRFKDDILNMINQYNDMTAAQSLVRIILNATEITDDIVKNLNSNGIEIKTEIMPSSMRISSGLRKVTESLSTKSTVPINAKIEIMSNVIKEGGIRTSKKGDVHAVASTFGISDKFSKRIIESTENNELPTKRASKSETIMKSNWPQLISSFCLTKPVCREAPGESVSVSYGVRAEKYLRQFSVKEIFDLFRIKYPEFPFGLTTFREYVPKNLVPPTLRDVKRNVCPLHENIRRSVLAFNRFLTQNQSKELKITTSTITLCLEGICKTSDNETENRNPLHWKSDCTKGLCSECGFSNWLRSLKESIEEKRLQNKTICYSRWVTEREGKKSKVILVKKTCNIIEFLESVLSESIATKKFPEHLRKAWKQWEVTKHPLIVHGIPGEVAIRTREDYQEDLKFLCLSETVSTHRGVGIITMLCYPVVLEIFHADGREELHGVIFMSDTKDKSFNTVYHLELDVFDYVTKLGYMIGRYDRISDGCSSQFWCWGTYTYIQSMTSYVPLINFHRYERYEGKNMSDALGSMVKRRAKECALKQRMMGLDSNGTDAILNDVNENNDFEDLVFENHKQAFEWLEMCMNKGENRYSVKFDAVKLIWRAKSSIPDCQLVEKEIKKMPKIKSYNCMSAMVGKEGFFVRDSSCNSCEHCQTGDMLSCSNFQGEGYVRHNTVKSTKVKCTNARNTKTSLASDPVDTESDDYSEPDLFYESEIEESVSESENTIDFEVPTSPLSQGLYVLLKQSDYSFFVGCITECFPKSRSLSFAKKFSVRNNEITFIWPEFEDVRMIANDNLVKDAIALPDPITTRRGSIKFQLAVFNDIPVSSIH